MLEKALAKKILAGKGLKATRGRDEILREIDEIDGHFDQEGLYKRLKEKGSRIGRASVYRTIPILVEGGIVREVEKTARHAHYEKVIENKHHDHLICLSCSKMIEFYSPTLEMLQDEICQREGFKGLRHSLEIIGLCRECALKGDRLE